MKWWSMIRTNGNFENRSWYAFYIVYFQLQNCVWAGALAGCFQKSLLFHALALLLCSTSDPYKNQKMGDFQIEIGGWFWPHFDWVRFWATSNYSAVQNRIEVSSKQRSGETEFSFKQLFQYCFWTKELLDHGTTDWNTSSMLIVDIRPGFWTYIHLYKYLLNYTFKKPVSFPNFSLKIEECMEVILRFLLCQRNKKIFSWSCFCK